MREPITPAETDALIERIRALSQPLDVIPTSVAEQLPRLEDIRAVIFDIYGTLFLSGSGEVGTRHLAAHGEP